LEMSVGEQNLADFHSPPPSEADFESNELRNRCLQLSDAFYNEWGTYPQILCRAPGRVNLIGEHIDYMGFSVLPMAVTNDILIAAGLDSESLSTVSVTNVDGSLYPKANFKIGVNDTDGRWHNYIACGVRGAVEDMKLENPKSMRMVVHGTIPPASGLSSSSAMVCAAALATYKLQEISSGAAAVPSKLHIASVCCRAERYIGTMGGGMDQVARRRDPIHASCSLRR
jgi:galactokinase